MSSIIAYFESEAARPQVPGSDHAYAVAVAAIGEDNGAKWRQWRATAPRHVIEAIAAAYADQAAAADRRAKGRRQALRAAYDAERATGKGQMAAAKAVIRDRADLCGWKPVHLFAELQGYFGHDHYFCAGDGDHI